MGNQEYYEKLTKGIKNRTLRTLEENDSFVAGCVQCGECCRNRKDILLSPHDLFNMVQATGLEVKKVLEKYTVLYLGSGSHLPIVNLKFREELDGTTACYFLGQKDGKRYCRINDRKPSACRMYPLGRMTAFEKGKTQNKNEQLPQYFVQPEGILCAGMICAKKNNSQHTLLEWVGGREKKDLADRYWILFYKFVRKLEKTINMDELVKLKNVEFANTVIDMMFVLLYLNYDFSGTQEDFLKQYEKNTNDLLNNLKIVVSSLNGKLKPKNQSA